MRRRDDTNAFREETSRLELAAIFAAAILRLSKRIPLTDSEYSDEAGTCLEVPPETVLSGHHG